MIRLDNPGQTGVRTGFEAIQNPATSPPEEMEKRERIMLIQEAIGSLPAKQRTVIVLRDIEGLSYEAVSNITGLKLGTVKSKLSRARLELRNKLRGKI